MRKIVANVSHGHYEGLMKLVDERDFFNPSEALRYCIQQTIKREFPGYLESKKGRPTPLTPTEKARERILTEEEEKEMKSLRAFEKKSAICEILGGEVIDINGYPHCKYPQYTEVGGGKVDIGTVTDPFTSLSEQAVEWQFRDIMGATGPAAKEKIEALLAK